MTNSVYYKEENSQKNIFYTTKIEESKYKEIADDADKDPVIVYVERVLARIDLKINIKNDKNNRKEGEDKGGKFYYYYTGTTIDAGTTGFTNGEDIYVRFLGWNVFDTPSKSRLIKSIDTSWNDNLFDSNGLLPWNTADFHRSFWAVNPALDTTNDYKKGSLVPEADLDNETGNADTTDKTFENWYAKNNNVPAPGQEYVTAYFQENAAPLEANATTTDKIYGDAYADYVAGAPVKPSKVILAAQLVDKDGKPRELAKWAGKYYYSGDALKQNLCNSPGPLLDLYYVETEATGDSKKTILHKIEPKHLAYQSNNGTYKVTVVLSDAGKEKTWYIGKNIDQNADFDESKTLTTDQANEHIKNAIGENTVMLWKNGYTYFYFTIRHLGYDKTSPAYYGVVRNHIYDATVNSVTGLGTPVSDPNEIIEVTPPDDDTGILAAQVRILSWRLVTQSYDLNW